MKECRDSKMTKSNDALTQNELIKGTSEYNLVPDKQNIYEEL